MIIEFSSPLKDLARIL